MIYEYFFLLERSYWRHVHIVHIMSTLLKGKCNSGLPRSGEKISRSGKSQGITFSVREI